ncbi:MAG: DNA polymerase III subunit epsilon [Coriobacteriales bacterium]|jgi:ATP-dependent DNA helicase DinG|nr:DNA polymerase III subunit epsilon [Coriobacteriales bacterium]
MPLALDAFLIPGTDPDVVERYRTLPTRAAEALFGAFEEEYVVLDTETTGLDPSRDTPIEIAAAILRGPQIVERFSTFVDPGRPIPPAITELTGISDGDVRGAPNAREATCALTDFVGERALIAHNASFDRAFIEASAPLGSAIADRDRWLDSLELSRIALPRMREHKLKSLAEAFGVPPATHRAIDDVEALCHLWRIMLVALSDLPPGLVALLAQLFPSTAWPLRPVLAQIAAAWGLEAHAFSLVEARRARERAWRGRQKVDALELDGGIVPLAAIGADELAAAFAPNGIVEAMYPRYEPRGEQLQMATEVADALAEGTHRAIEAGTGVGKSMAYLVPLALFATRNHVACGVATKTNTLLDQLMYSELPRLDAAMPDGLSYVALKGYEHYPCLRKLMHLARADRSFKGEGAGAPALIAALLTFVCSSARGDLDPLSLNWRGLARWEVCASAEDCLKRSCRYYARCLLHGARRAAAEADIVVTNHALLFCDVMAAGGILPPIRQWVVDEAHGMEAEARRQLTLAIEERSMTQTLDGLLSSTGTLMQLLNAARALAGSSLLIGRIEAVRHEAASLPVLGESFFSYLKDLHELTKHSSYDRVDLWINEQVRQSTPWSLLSSAGLALAKRLELFLKDAQDIVSLASQFEELAEPTSDLIGRTADLKHAFDALVLILDGGDRDYVYYAELDRRPEVHFDRLLAARLDIGAVLLEDFFPNEMSVTFTSATLAAGSDFSYFARACGLDRLPEERWRAVQLHSSYDYERNMAVFLANDLPEPGAHGYREALERLLLEAHRALGGSVLTLFTNRRDMEAAFSRLKGPLLDAGVTLRCQSRGFNARHLREEFLADRATSLFALRSFWEGFDAPGDTLRCVIIPKLPFSRPSDPLMQERALGDADAWRHYALPEAILDLKQAAGRLIRSSTDSGALILADTRLLTKRYGRAFLDALPSQQRHVLNTEQIAAALRTMSQAPRSTLAKGGFEETDAGGDAPVEEQGTGHDAPVEETPTLPERRKKRS